MSGPRIGRRPLLAATATGGLAVAGLAVANRTGLLGGSDGAAAAVLQLQDTTDGVQMLEFALGEDVLPAVGANRWQTEQLPTSTHSMVAVTWRAGRARPAVEISSRLGGQWQSWQPLLPLHDLPDPAGGEGNGRAGTDLAWVGPADGVRVRLSGTRPKDLRLVLLHPARTALLKRRASQSQRARTLVLKPPLLTRRDWEANPAYRDGTASYNQTIEQVHVHHTVNSNDYAADDVPGLIRGMYSYHTRSLGWSDIAYNFLVDRFGRIWVGRAGGPDKPVRGAHTLGFNATSTGIAAIGNYDTVKPSTKLLDAIAHVAAWKLAQYNRNPQGQVAVTSEGSDRYRSGSKPRLPVVDGHRDTNDTACPGANLYASLPTIRSLAQQRLQGSKSIELVTEPTLRGQLVADRTLQVAAGQTDPAAQVSYQWLRGSAVITGATAASFQTSSADVGSVLTVVITYTANGYESTKRTLTTAGPIRAVPSIAVEAVSSRRGVLVTVNVTAPGAQAPATGTVIVDLPKRQRSAVMADGQVRVLFRKPLLKPRPVLVRYAGNDEILSGKAETSVAIS